MRGLKLREVKGLTQGHTAARGELTPSLVCYALLPTLRAQSACCDYGGGEGKDSHRSGSRDQIWAWRVIQFLLCHGAACLLGLKHW